MFVVDVLKSLRSHVARNALAELVVVMSEGQMDDLGLGAHRDLRQQAETRRLAAAAGWGPWRL